MTVLIESTRRCQRLAVIADGRIVENAAVLHRALIVTRTLSVDKSTYRCTHSVINVVECVLVASQQVMTCTAAISKPEARLPFIVQIHSHLEGLRFIHATCPVITPHPVFIVGNHTQLVTASLTGCQPFGNFIGSIGKKYFMRGAQIGRPIGVVVLVYLCAEV